MFWLRIRNVAGFNDGEGIPYLIYFLALRASRCHLPLHNLSALRPRISFGAGSDSGRRASSSDTFPTLSTTSYNSNNIVLSDVTHAIENILSMSTRKAG
jgi:hypothetical protein